jgi:uncharacterized protein YbjT (DUF2867 family)
VSCQYLLTQVHPFRHNAITHALSLAHLNTLSRTLCVTPPASRHEVWAGHTVVVCALGTTRAIAGSAESFVKVDRDYVIAAAEAARAAGIPRFLLLTAQGSGGVPTFLPRSVVSAIHPLLYTQTKYEAETAVKSQGFSTVSIFRPGLLDRRVPGADYRSVESLFLKVGGWVCPVARFAR